MNEFLKLDLSLKENEEEIKCKGLFFRAARTSWMNNEGIGDTTRLRKLKKMSCQGCSSCDWLQDDFHESMGYWGDFPWIGINEIEHGKIYTVSVWSERDYFGEYDYEISLVEVKE